MTKRLNGYPKVNAVWLSDKFCGIITKKNSSSHVIYVGDEIRLYDGFHTISHIILQDNGYVTLLFDGVETMSFSPSIVNLVDFIERDIG